MKSLIYTAILALLLAGTSAITAQDIPEESLGLPGDNLNLFAVMNLFQNSTTLEAFERELNSPESMTNNLDLNNDNQVDYILVFDYPEDNTHTIVLRVALNQDEFQDVAVFTVQKYNNGSVVIQLVGDEALYGPNYIVEPVYAETPNPGYTGKRNQGSSQVVVETTYFEVADWPLIVYIYTPMYSPWHSMWSWGYYPTYWSPWTPHYWHYYYGYHYNYNVHYHAYYRHWRHNRCDRYQTYYYGRVRKYSPTLAGNVKGDRYRNTYSRPDRKRDGYTYASQRHPNGRPEGYKENQSAGDRVRPSGNKTEASDRVGRSNGSVYTKPQRVNSASGSNSNQNYRRPGRINNTETDRSNVSSKPSVQSTESDISYKRPASKESGSAVSSRPARESTNSSGSSVSKPSSERSTNRSSSGDRSSSTSVERSKPVREKQSSSTKTEPSRQSKDTKGTKSSPRSNESSKKESTTKTKSENNQSRKR